MSVCFSTSEQLPSFKGKEGITCPTQPGCVVLRTYEALFPMVLSLLVAVLIRPNIQLPMHGLSSYSNEVETSTWLGCTAVSSSKQ